MSLLDNAGLSAEVNDVDLPPLLVLTMSVPTSHTLHGSIHPQMPRFTLLAALLVLLLAITTSSAFTPDAAFKRAQIHLTAGNADQKNVYVYTQHNKNRHFLSTVDNLRKSVTNPPSFEDYMALRRRHQNQQLQQLQNSMDGGADHMDQQPSMTATSQNQNLR